MYGRYPYCTDAVPAFLTCPMTSKMTSSSGHARERPSSARRDSAKIEKRKTAVLMRSRCLMTGSSHRKIAPVVLLSPHEVVENLWFARLTGHGVSFREMFLRP